MLLFQKFKFFVSLFYWQYIQAHVLVFNHIAGFWLWQYFFPQWNKMPQQHIFRNLTLYTLSLV